jgi:hypothetical protein
LVAIVAVVVLAGFALVYLAQVGTSTGTALAAMPAADAAAREWDPNSQLVRIGGVEGPLPSTGSSFLRSDPEPWENAAQEAAASDPSKGDGRSRFWQFQYASGKGGYGVVVRDGGTVIYQGPQPLAGAYRPFSAAGLLDSDAALSRAQAALPPPGNVSAYMIFLQDAGRLPNPAWNVIAVGRQPGGVFIDAVTGAVIGG